MVSIYLFLNFRLGSVSKEFTKDEQSEISFNGTAHNFSVDHNLIEEQNIRNTHQYLMVKNDLK